MSPHSICAPMPKGKYQCLCPETGFDIKSRKSLGTDSDGKELLLEECNDKDECAQGKCSGPHQLCLNTVGSYKCSCNHTFKFNANQTECIPVCTDVKCNYGKCFPTGKDGYRCECESGYSDKDCSSKDEGIYKLHTETKQTLFIENNS